MNKQMENRDRNKEKIADEFMDYNQFTSEYDHEVQDIDLLSKKSEQILPYYPSFFMGSLKEACQAAFRPNTIAEYLPVLVYIHRDGSRFGEKFCRTMFYSNKLIQYLNMNYIFWSYNITDKSNRLTLMNVWEDIFSTRFSDEFSIEECPLLIGIMRLCKYNINGIIASEYQFKALVKGNILIRTGIKIDHENLFNELNHFKDECDNNEKHLSFNFIKKTHLSWEIILEIAEYLSISDVITTFSIDILTLLNHKHFKMKLLNPYDRLTKIILPKIQIEQITSLQINANGLHSENELAVLSNFPKIRSISVHNLVYSVGISQYAKYLPSLTRICLYYDDKANYYELIRKLIHFPQRIKQCEIHCSGTFYNYNPTKDIGYPSDITTSLEYFLLNISQYPSTSLQNSSQDYKSWFRISIHSFIQKMPRIQHFHIICNKYNIEYVLGDDLWKSPLCSRLQLKKLTLEIAKSAYENQQWLIKKVMEIQLILYKIQKTIKFQFIFV
ncbi:hypothetical protein I4U23_011343 [Adineta vaga]|nr:hypothetical protein I4U23_011343 [Adineta vaga]